MLWVIAVATCIALLYHALSARRDEPEKAEPPKPLPSRSGFAYVGAAIAVLLVVAAFWLTLAVVLPLLAWLFWIGDNDHWFWRASPYVAAVAALLAAGPLFYRIAAQDTGPRFFLVQGSYGAVVLAAWGAAWLVMMVEPIKGSDPLQAAKEIVREWGEDPEDFTYQPSTNKEVPGYVPDTHTYLVVGPEEPRGRITVQRHMGYWWKAIATHRYPPSAGELARVKQLIARDPTNSSIRLILEEIEYDYPNTSAAEEAVELLRKLKEPAAQRAGQPDDVTSGR